MRRRPTPKRGCGKILTLLYEAWLCFLTLLVEGLPLKFNTGWCVCKFDTVTPEPKLVKIGHVTRKCITTCSLYVNVSLRQVTKCLNDVNGTYIPEPRGSGAFLFLWLLNLNWGYPWFWRINIWLSLSGFFFSWSWKRIWRSSRKCMKFLKKQRKCVKKHKKNKKEMWYN